MKIAIIYISPNGTTKKTANELKFRLSSDQQDVELFDLGSVDYRNNFQPILESLKDFDIVGFGSPVYHMEMLSPITTFFYKLIKMKTKFSLKAFLFVNYGGITSGKSFLKSTRLLNRVGIPVIGAMKLVAPHFHNVEEFPNDLTIKNIENFCNKLKTNSFNIINKKTFIPKMIINLIYPFVHIIGKIRELPINIVDTRCKVCKKCIKECPVKAISIDTNVIINSNVCIHCYHCIACCPFDAIESPIEKLDQMIMKNKKIVGMENPLNKIYFKE